jgi:hypothetical protein
MTCEDNEAARMADVHSADPLTMGRCGAPVALFLEPHTAGEILALLEAATGRCHRIHVSTGVPERIAVTCTTRSC